MRTPLENLFLAMMNEGWATYSDGETQSPTGHFALIINEPNELLEIREAFWDEIEMYGSPTDEDMTGAFIVRVDDQGAVSISAFANYAAAYQEYAELEEEYRKWDQEPS